jgi:hypothetical protein
VRWGGRRVDASTSTTLVDAQMAFVNAARQDFGRRQPRLTVRLGGPYIQRMGTDVTTAPETSNDV